MLFPLVSSILDSLAGVQNVFLPLILSSPSTSAPSYWSKMTSDTLIMIDDTDSGINYSGGWTADKGSKDSLGNFGAPYESTSHYTKGTGSFSYTFSGTYVGIFGSSLSSNNPSRVCTVDGQTIPSSNLSFMVNWIMHCQIDGLTDGKHTIEVTVPTPNADGYWFDFLMYIPSASVSRTNAALMIISDDSSINYGSGWAPSPPGNIATENGATMSIPFTGRSLTWMGFYLSQFPAAPTTGTYSVDGGSSFTFALDGSQAQTTGAELNQRFFTTGLLPAGQHTIKVTYNGNSNTVPLSLYNVIVQNGDSAGVSVGGSIGASIPATATSNSGGTTTSSGPSGSSSPSSPSSSVVVIGTGTSAVTVTLSNTNSTVTALPSGSGSATGTTSSTQSGSGAVSSGKPSSGEPSSASETSSDSHPGNAGNLGNTSSATSKSHSHVGIIVGVVVGVLALLLLFLLFFLRRRDRKRRERANPSNPSNVQPFTSPPGSTQATMSQVSHTPNTSLLSRGNNAAPQLYSDNKRLVPGNVSGVGPTSSDARNAQHLTPNKPWRWQQARSSQPIQQPSVSTFSSPATDSSGPSEPEVIVLHEDSGVRLPADGTVRPGITVVEMPPTYSAT